MKHVNLNLNLEENNTNLPIERLEKEENDVQLLNKKRKQSEGLSELRNELLEK